MIQEWTVWFVASLRRVGGKPNSIIPCLMASIPWTQSVQWERATSPILIPTKNCTQSVEKSREKSSRVLSPDFGERTRTDTTVRLLWKIRTKLGRVTAQPVLDIFPSFFLHNTHELFNCVMVWFILVILQIGLRSNSARLASRVGGSNPGHFSNSRYFLHCTGTYWKVIVISKYKIPKHLQKCLLSPLLTSIDSMNIRHGKL